jgi:hypothetical protein
MCELAGSFRLVRELQEKAKQTSEHLRTKRFGVKKCKFEIGMNSGLSAQYFKYAIDSRFAFQNMMDKLKKKLN